MGTIIFSQERYLDFNEENFGVDHEKSVGKPDSFRHRKGRTVGKSPNLYHYLFERRTGYQVESFVNGSGVV